ANSELCVIRDAYELATHLFTGCFIPSGRTLIAHAVGTASILGALHLPVEMVAAGLLHNVYETGDFGDGRRGISEARRRHIKQAVGARVEEYLSRFPAIQRLVIAVTRHHPPQTLATVHNRLAPLDLVDCQVLLVALADQLEHGLNREYANRNPLCLKELAEQIGFPTLATDLAQAFSTAEVKAAGTEPRRAQFVNPRSYCTRSWLTLRPKFNHSFYRVRATLGIRKRLYPLVRRISRLPSVLSLSAKH